jgi:hypothetical protein
VSGGGGLVVHALVGATGNAGDSDPRGEKNDCGPPPGVASVVFRGGIVADNTGGERVKG